MRSLFASSARLGALGTLLLLGIAGCDPAPITPPPDAGSDAPACCTTDADCDDGAFCNGEETCDPVRCCVPAAAPACGAERTCDEATDACRTACEIDPDVDGDGHDAAECDGDDCDDGDPLRYPGATEICDDADRDEDCDAATYGTRDVDGDGDHDSACCNGAGPTAACGTDCNDSRRDVNLDGAEVCNGVDDDCDGAVDEGVDVDGWLDRDFDGWGAIDPAEVDGGGADLDAGAGTTRLRACPGTPGFALVSGDCNDANPAQSPGLVEACDLVDNDCDGMVDDNTGAVNWYADADEDGFGNARRAVRSCAPPVDPADPTLTFALIAFDCDDTRDTVNPASPEICDGIDNDCNGRADFVISGTNLEDDDRDGFPDAACSPGGDCRDTDATTYPGAPELCDDRDNDCDDVVDDGTVIQSWYLDNDRDGDGDASGTGVMSCPPIAGRVVPHGIDNNCDGSAVGEDLDGDGFRALGSVCEGGPRAALPANDCDDTRASVRPGGVDTCNGLDDDCDGVTDQPGALLCSTAQVCSLGSCECVADRGDCSAAVPGCEANLQAGRTTCGDCTTTCGTGARCAGGTCRTSVRRVFVSSAPVLANMGGAAGADMRCQGFADAANLGGSWRAWLSTDTSSPSTRFTQSTVPYVTTRGVTVASSWTDLTDGTLAAPIDADEYGRLRPSYEAWTATSNSGAASSANCANFTAALAAGDTPCVGGAHTNYRWTCQYQQFCNRTNVSLLCFEQ